MFPASQKSLSNEEPLRRVENSSRKVIELERTVISAWLPARMGRDVAGAGTIHKPACAPGNSSRGGLGGACHLLTGSLQLGFVSRAPLPCCAVFPLVPWACPHARLPTECETDVIISISQAAASRPVPTPVPARRTPGAPSGEDPRHLGLSSGPCTTSAPLPAHR